MKNFRDAVGTDISSENISKLKDLGYDNIYLASPEDFHLDRKFDNIVAGELIEQLSNLGLFLEQAKEHLTEGGRLVVTTPYPFSLLYTFYALFTFPKTCQNPEHTCWFCPKTFMELVKRVGFRITSWVLIEDYQTDVPLSYYRLVVWFISLFFGRFIPKRLRCNKMLFYLRER